MTEHTPPSPSAPDAAPGEPPLAGVQFHPEPRYGFEFTIDPRTRFAMDEWIRSHRAGPRDVQKDRFVERLGTVVGSAVAVSLTTAWFFHRTIREPTSTIFGATFGGMCGVLIGLVISGRSEAESKKKRWQAADAYVRQVRALGPLRVELWDAGVRICRGMGAHSCTWHGIRNIRAIGDVIAIEMWDGGLTPVPAVATGEDDRRAEILAFARDRLDAAGGGEPGYLRRQLADHDAACPKCRYALRGCNCATCPECGLSLTVEMLGLRRPRTPRDLGVALEGPVWWEPS